MKKAAAWALCLLWMGVIFFMSAAPGEVSAQQNGWIAQLVFSALRLCLGERAAAIPAEAVHLAIRKGAHMAEYAVLFLLLRRALRLSGARRPGLDALALCAGYAATDEWHQSFVAGRGPSPLDVLIDTTGAAIAWGLTALCTALSRRTPGSSLGN